MDANGVLRSLRYALNIDDRKMAEIFAKGGLKVSLDRMERYLLPEEDETFIPCENEDLITFLDGLILIKRGPSDKTPAAPDRITNNLILKKIRIAFNLKEEDMLEILDLGEFRVSKPELSALFRRPGHRHYRECGDQLLRRFLKGLTIKQNPNAPK